MAKPRRRTYLALSLLGLTWILLRLNTFSLAKIEGPLLEGFASPSSKHVLPYLTQPYFYLSKGRQCFVFVSEDGNSVIKLFNYDRFRFPSLLKTLTPHLSAYAHKRHNRFRNTMLSLLIAHTFLREETGLIALHLQKSSDLPPLLLFDSLDRGHVINLNTTAFILQKRAIPLADALKDQNLPHVIDECCRFLQIRCEQGISDDDRDIMHNFGFVHDKLINVDPGRLFFSQKLSPNNKDLRENIEKELRIATKRLRRYILTHHPEQLPYLDSRITHLTEVLLKQHHSQRTTL